MNTGAPQVMYLHRETIICVKFRENPSTAVLRKEVKLKLIFYLYALYCQLHLLTTELTTEFIKHTLAARKLNS